MFSDLLKATQLCSDRSGFWICSFFILSHPYKLMVGLTLSDHICHFAYSKISAFRSRKGQSGYREEWKWPNESEDDPACGGHWEKKARNSNIRSQLQFIWGKRPSSSGAVTSFQLPDQSVLVSRHLVWHNTIPSSKGTITEIVSFAVFRRLCVKQENHLGASQTWVEISQEGAGWHWQDPYPPVVWEGPDDGVCQVPSMELTIIALYMVADLFLLIQRQDVMMKGPLGGFCCCFQLNDRTR